MSERCSRGGWWSAVFRIGLWLGLLLGGWRGGALDLLVYEPFDYPAGGLATKRGGTGFLGSWLGGVPDASVTANYAVAAGSLAVNGLEVSGGMAQASAQTVNLSGLRRTLTTSLGFNDTVRYLSFVARADGTLHAGLFNGFFGLRLIGSGPAHLYVGKPGGGAIARYVLEDAGGQRQHATSITIPRGEPRLLVLKCEFRSGNDRFSLFVNPIPGGDEPASPDAVKEDLDAGFVSALGLNSAGAWTVDELRVGTTWESVTPKEPAFRLQLAEERNGREHTIYENRVATVQALPSGRALNFELIGETRGASIDADTGVFRWVPGELEGGQTASFRVRATETSHPENTATVDIPIWVEEANQLAVVHPLEPVQVSEGESLQLALFAEDPDQPAQQLTFHLAEGPEGLAVSATGLLEWKPVAAQLDDTFLVRIAVDDGMDLGPETLLLINTHSSSRATELPPELSAASLGQSVRLTWPAAPAGNWRLETASVLDDSRWSAIDRVPVLRNGTFELEVNTDLSSSFFRLAGAGLAGPILTNVVAESAENLFGGRTWLNVQLAQLPSAGQLLEVVETADGFERTRRFPYEFLGQTDRGYGLWLRGDDLLLGRTIVQARWLDALGNRLGGVGLLVTNEPTAGAGATPLIGELKWGGADGIVRIAPDPLGFVMPQVELELSDPDGDLARIELNWSGPNGEQGSAIRSLAGAGTGTNHWTFLPFAFNAASSLGQWQLTARVYDTAGHSAQATTQLEHTASTFISKPLSPPQLWLVTPTNAAPGDLIQLWFRDIEEADLTNCLVRIGGMPTPLVGSFAGGIKVVVPLDTWGDRIEVTTPTGGTTYRGLFRVETHPRLEPTQLTLLPGQPALFRWDRRLPVGSSVTWTASVGQIAADGVLRAPTFVTEPTETRVRGIVTLNGAEWADEVVVNIQASPMPRGSGWVSAVTGGSVASEDLTARVEFPPGALTTDTNVTVRVLASTELPVAPEGLTTLGAVEFGPEGLRFLKAATVVLPLAVSRPAGERIPVRIWNPEQQRWEDEVLEGHVGASGREVNVEAHHFSIYVPMASVALVADAPVLERISPAEFAEGLHGPVQVSGKGFGPGVSIDIVEADGSPAAGFFAGALVLGRMGPQGDDTQRAGFLLDTPVLRTLGAGQVRTVFVRARKFGQPESRIPFTIRGLPEFDANDLAVVPPGANRFEGLYSEIVVRTQLPLAFDFSEFRATRRIVIEPGGLLDATGKAGMSGGMDVAGQPIEATAERRGGIGGQRGAGQNALVTANYAFPARGLRLGFGGAPGASFSDFYGASGLADCTGMDALTCFESLLEDLREDPFEFQIVAERTLTEFLARLPDGRRGSSGIWRGAPMSWALGGSGFIISDNARWIRTYGPGSGGGGGGASGAGLGIEGWNGGGGAGGMGGGAVRLACEGDIRIEGAVRANGGDGGRGGEINLHRLGVQSGAFFSAGGGGGGGAGAVRLIAGGSLTYGPNGFSQAFGGRVARTGIATRLYNVGRGIQVEAPYNEELQPPEGMNVVSAGLFDETAVRNSVVIQSVITVTPLRTPDELQRDSLVSLGRQDDRPYVDIYSERLGLSRRCYFFQSGLRTRPQFHVHLLLWEGMNVIRWGLDGDQPFGMRVLSLSGVDDDGDGIATEDELARGLDPQRKDTDADGIEDGNELAQGTNPLLKDTDGDLLTDIEELALRSSPNNVDTDDDGVWDGAEAYRGESPTEFRLGFGYAEAELFAVVLNDLGERVLALMDPVTGRFGGLGRIPGNTADGLLFDARGTLILAKESEYWQWTGSIPFAADSGPPAASWSAGGRVSTGVGGPSTTTGRIVTSGLGGVAIPVGYEHTLLDFRRVVEADGDLIFTKIGDLRSANALGAYTLPVISGPISQDLRLGMFNRISGVFRGPGMIGQTYHLTNYNLVIPPVVLTEIPAAASPAPILTLAFGRDTGAFAVFDDVTGASDWMQEINVDAGGTVGPAFALGMNDAGPMVYFGARQYIGVRESGEVYRVDMPAVLTSPLSVTPLSTVSRPVLHLARVPCVGGCFSQVTVVGAGPIPGGFRAYGMIQGDFDGNGALDLAISGQDGVQTTVHILHGDGTGRFQRVSSHVVGTGSVRSLGSMKLASMDASPELDLMVAWDDSATSGFDLAVVPGTSDGKFASPHSIAMGVPYSGFTVGAFDGAGTDDLVVVDSRTVLFPGNATGTFDSQPSVVLLPTTSATVVAEMADVDASGRNDLVRVGEILDVHADGAQVSTSQRTLGFGGVSSMKFGDYNGDGKPDLFFTGYSGFVRVCVGTGTGSFDAPIAVAPGTLFGITPKWDVADVNGDGRSEVLFPDVFGKRIQVLERRGALPNYEIARGLPTSETPEAVVVGDANQDRLPDLLVLRIDGSVEVFLGR